MKAVVLPVSGKMAIRTFHQEDFIRSMSKRDLKACFMVDASYFSFLDLDDDRYGQLQVKKSTDLLNNSLLRSLFVQLRRFSINTETAELRFRSTLEEKMFEPSHPMRTLLFGVRMDILRHIPGIGRLSVAIENKLSCTSIYQSLLNERQVKCVLVPGLGNWGFWNELVLAREAQQMGIPTVAAITNYDNLVNRGYRGFMPDYLAVWSRLMADEAIRLHEVPSNRIEITGPVQYDVYFKKLPVTREAYLTSKGLDPTKKTILYAGGVNIRSYFEILTALEPLISEGSAQKCNLILRVYPHPKILSLPEWEFLQNHFLKKMDCIYVSNPIETSTDSLTKASIESTMSASVEFDELACLLKFSDVMINHYSTIALEAAICDLPTIHVGYDSNTYGLKYSNTAAFQKKQTHNLRIKRLEGARIADSREDLMNYTEHYLSDKSLDKTKRYEYALAECEYLDGQAGKRLIKLIEKAV